MTVAIRLSGPGFPRTFNSGGVSDAANHIDNLIFENRALQAEMAKIAELATDSEIPLSVEAMGSALYFLQRIFARGMMLGSWSSPLITLSEAGEIVFEWWHDDKKITFYFGEGQPEYIKVWGTDIDTEMDSGVLTDGWNLTSVWLWLNS